MPILNRVSPEGRGGKLKVLWFGNWWPATKGKKKSTSPDRETNCGCLRHSAVYKYFAVAFLLLQCRIPSKFKLEFYISSLERGQKSSRCKVTFNTKPFVGICSHAWYACYVYKPNSQLETPQSLSQSSEGSWLLQKDAFLSSRALNGLSAGYFPSQKLKLRFL